MSHAIELPVGGWQPFTMVDFPGILSAVVFCQGCPWKCRYCHNADLQDFRRDSPTLRWPMLVERLRKRRGFLDGVVFSGGEPTAHSGLPAAIRECREMGFSIGLHTAGIYPGRLRGVLPLVDWVGFDVKAPLDVRYDRVTLVKDSASRVGESLRFLKESGVCCQLRVTCHPALLTARDLDEIRAEVKRRELPAPVFQMFRAEGCVDRNLIEAASVYEESSYQARQV